MIDAKTVSSTDPTMVLFTYMNIILLAILNTTLAKDCVINNVPERMAFEKQLKKDLASDYISYEPPGSNSSTLAVHVRFRLRRFKLNSDLGVFSVQTRMFISWKDERLKWDPEKYYGINGMDILSVKIWTPAFRLFNSVDVNDFVRFYRVLCLLQNTGDVYCPLMVTHEALCGIKLTQWPYDQQECSLEFGARTSKSTHFRMNFTSRAISLIAADYEPNWFISDYRQEANHSSERQLKMIFVLERCESGGLGAIVVYPVVILTVLSVTCLFLDVRRLVRLAIACFSFLGHYYFMTELATTIPKHNSGPPNLVLYYRGSGGLTVLIILFTFLLRILCKLKLTPHNYILSINNAVFESYGKYFIFPLWNVDDDTIDIRRYSQDWTKFANIIGSVFSVVIIIAYVSMYCALVPQRIPLHYSHLY